MARRASCLPARPSPTSSPRSTRRRHPSRLRSTANSSRAKPVPIASSTTAMPSSLSNPSPEADMSFQIGGVALESRFFLGTAGYPSPQVLQQAIAASGSQVVTVGLKRQLAAGGGPGDFYQLIRASGAHLLPNTAGCRSAREAVTLAHMARELFGTN